MLRGYCTYIKGDYSCLTLYCANICYTLQMIILVYNIKNSLHTESDHNSIIQACTIYIQI